MGGVSSSIVDGVIATNVGPALPGTIFLTWQRQNIEQIRLDLKGYQLVCFVKVWGKTQIFILAKDLAKGSMSILKVTVAKSSPEVDAKCDIKVTQEYGGIKVKSGL